MLQSWRGNPVLCWRGSLSSAQTSWKTCGLKLFPVLMRSYSTSDCCVGLEDKLKTCAWRIWILLCSTFHSEHGFFFWIAVYKTFEMVFSKLEAEADTLEVDASPTGLKIPTESNLLCTGFIVQMMDAKKVSSYLLGFSQNLLMKGHGSNHTDLWSQQV